MKKLIVAFALGISFLLPIRAQSVAELEKGFKTPPNDARIMMRWWWFGPTVNRAELAKELKTMRDGGIGGVEVQPVYPLLPDDPKAGIRNIPYLSDEFLQMLRFTADTTKQLGMRMDLTLGSGWSFGGATTPITEAAGQLRIERAKINADTRRVPIPSMIPAEQFLGAFLIRSESAWLELKDVRDDNLWLTADDAKLGSEIIFVIGGKSGMQVKRPAVGSEGYVLNHLDKPSVDGYLRKTGDRLYSAFLPSNRPYSFFCDSLEVYQQDWTDSMLAEFQKRRGYDLRPLLPALVLDKAPNAAEIRYDWGRTITEVFNDNFMMPMQAWAKRNGTKFRIQGYGVPPAAISSNEWADISDGEGAQWHVVRAARWASSANHIFGRNVTSSETWTWLHSPAFRATPLDMKAEADIHFLQGINQLIGHGWAYTPPQVEYPGWCFYAAGEYSDRNPWWIVMPDLAKYLQRMSWVMRQGKPSNDVALYLPNADAYAHFSPAKVHLIDVERELVGEKILPALFTSGFNLDFFDDAILQKHGSVAKETLNLGQSSYKAVVLPGIERMPIESARKIRDFVKNGGILIATRRKPSMVPGMKATDAEKTEFASIMTDLFGGSNPRVKFVVSDDDAGKALKSVLQPDVEILGGDEFFGFVHRKTANADIYFVANTSNQKKNVEIRFRDSRKTLTVLNAMNGESNFYSNMIDGGTKVSTWLEPYESRVYVFSNTGDASADLVAPGKNAAIDLGQNWSVTFAGKQPVSYPDLMSWTDSDDTKFFSGTASYEKTVDVPAGAYAARIDFGDAVPLEFEVQRNGMRTYLDPPIKEAAVVYVNGQRAGSVWCPPYVIDVSKFVKPGPNQLKIVVANTAVNYMAGRKLPDYRLLNLRYGERFQPQEMEKVMPYTSGMTGSPKLVVFRR